MTFVTITVTSQGVHSLSIVLIDVTVPSNTRVLLGAAASDRPSPAIEVTTPTAATMKWSPSRMFPRPANDLPFSSERQGRLRAYHGREEPRAQPAASRHGAIFERTGVAFVCCNGLLGSAKM